MKVLVIVLYFMKILGSVTCSVLDGCQKSCGVLIFAAQPDPCSGRISKAATIIE